MATVSELDSLTKYSGTKDLTVLVHLNQQVCFSASDLVVPAGARIAALWIMACVSPDQLKWVLWGNYLEQLERSEFAYPA